MYVCMYVCAKTVDFHILNCAYKGTYQHKKETEYLSRILENIKQGLTTQMHLLVSFLNCGSLEQLYVRC